MEKNRRRIPTIPHLHPRSPMYMHAENRRPARPHPGTHAAPKPIGSVPGNPRDARTSAWLPPDAPPVPPGSMVPP